MVVPQQIIDSIKSTMTVRTMRLPVERGTPRSMRWSPELIVPAREGGRYGLQAGRFQPSQTSIVVISVCRQPATAVDLEQAQREGHKTVQAAIDAFGLLFGDAPEAWVIHFARDAKDGNVSDHIKSDEPVLLASGGGYTTIPSRAMAGEPEVMGFATDLEKARVKAREARVSPQREKVKRITDQVGELRKDLEAMKTRNRLRRIEHDLAKLAEELPSDDGLHSGVLVARDAPHMDAERHHRDESLASVEAA